MVYGSCVDGVLKAHLQFDNSLYMYVFEHRSEYEPLPLWMGKFIIILSPNGWVRLLFSCGYFQVDMASLHCIRSIMCSFVLMEYSLS